MFNGYNNSLSKPSINGLQSIKADDITSGTITSDNLTLGNLEVNDIVIDTDLTMQSGANIIANSKTISDVEISYLDGVTGNIENRIAAVEDKTQQMTYATDLTTITNLRANELSSAEITSTTVIADAIEVDAYIQYPDLNTQYYAFTDTLYDKLNDTTLINATNKLDPTLIGTGIVDQTEFNYLNGVTSNIQDQIDAVVDYSTEITALQNKTANISTNGNSITLDTIFFNNLGYIDFIGTGTRQYKAFTNDLYNKLNDTTLINSEYKLTPLLIGNGLINETEFDYLNGVTSNIQTQLNDLDTKIDSIEITESNKLNANLISNGLVDNTEFDYLNGVTSNIQTQLNSLDTRIDTLEEDNLDSRITTLENNTLWLKYNLNINNLLSITPVAGTDYTGTHTYTTAPFGPGRFMITFILNLGAITRLMVAKSRLTLTNTVNGTYSTKWVGRNRDVVTSEEDYVYYSHSCFFYSNTTTSSISIETEYDIRAGTAMACSGTLEIIQI